MSTPAQTAASIQNAQASTGPRTEIGLATSSKNAITHGLYSNDFIRPGEETLYADLTEILERQLHPVGLLEDNLMDEILRATWRLRRCGQVEGSLVAQLTNGSDPIPDPMQNEATAKIQNSVDRARALAHRLLHKSTNELRRLQTNRIYLDETFPEGANLAHLGIADFRSIMKGCDEKTQAALHTRKLEEPEDVFRKVEREYRQLVAGTAERAKTPETKRTQEAAPQPVQIGRNTLCPCKSGQKYKRCCGKNAPALLHAA